MLREMFSTLNSEVITDLIRGARSFVAYAAPGIQRDPAEAIADVVSDHNPQSQVVLDFDEKTLRLGYGELSAVRTLMDAGVEIGVSPGMRSGILVVDEQAWVFTPVPLYLEPDPAPGAINAVRVDGHVARALLAELSAGPPKAPETIRDQVEGPAVSAPLAPLQEMDFEEVHSGISSAPPVKFDVARQVRVFEPYLQYVELSLTGAAIQRKRVEIPRVLQGLGADEALERRLRTTFDLIEGSEKVSSKHLEDRLNELRRDFTRSLGKDHGRVILRNAKPHLVERLKDLRLELEKHQLSVETELQTQLDAAQEQVATYYLPLVKENPPDALLGETISSDLHDTAVKSWVANLLAKVFPTAEELVSRMELHERYKDVTFETLNEDGFLEALKKAYPSMDWDRAYEAFLAAGEG